MNIKEFLASTAPKAEPTPDEPTAQAGQRTQFIINQLTELNVGQKVVDMKVLLQQEHPTTALAAGRTPQPLSVEKVSIDWFAQYLVVKRVASQANFHSVYLSFIQKLATKENKLLRSVLRCTLGICRQLLSSDTIRVEEQERRLLKTLGGWLGLITLTQNKPVLHRDLDLKELLYVAYEHGSLVAVMPFVAKVMDGAQSSKIFRPPNPWTMALMNALREMYDVPDLKLFLKFEVVRLCKALKLVMEEDLRNPGHLAMRRSPPTIDNPDLTNKANAAAAERRRTTGGGQLADTGALGDNISGMSGGDGAPGAGGENGAGMGGEGTVIPNLAAYVHINQQLPLFKRHPRLAHSVPLAVDRAIRDIIQPVVERSVTIACITTRELVLKDFATEADEGKLLQAAQVMVRTLSGSLALVTCKEPLLQSIANHLRLLLASATNMPQGQTDPEHEEAAVVCAKENLELGCMLIEKAATEKSVRDISESLAAPLQERRLHNERHQSLMREARMAGRPMPNPVPFLDSNVDPTARFPRSLPEVLRPHPLGLHEGQLRVYQAFNRAPRQPQPQKSVAGVAALDAAPTAASSAAAAAAQAAEASARGATGSAGSGADGQALPRTMTHAQATEKYLKTLNRLEGALQKIFADSGGNLCTVRLRELAANHQVRSWLREVHVTGQSTIAAACDEAASGFAERVLKRMFEVPRPCPVLRLESYLEILRTLRNVTEGRLVTRLTSVLIGGPTVPPSEERQLNRDIVPALLQHRLIKISDYDVYLAQVIDGVAGGRGGAQGKGAARIASAGLEFARLLLHHVSTDGSALRTSEFPQTIGRIVRLATPPKTGPGVQPDALHRVHRLDKQKGRDLMALAQKLAAAQRKEAQAGQSRPPAAGGADAAQAVAPEVREHAAHYLRSWYMLCQKGMLPRVAPIKPEPTPAALVTFFGRMQEGGLLRAGDRTWRSMMTALINLAVDQALGTIAAAPAGKEDAPAPDYSAIDSLASLIVNAVKYYPTPDNQARLGFFDWTMSIIADHMIADQRRRGGAWNQRPFFRLLLEIIQTVGDSDPCLDVDVQTDVVIATASASDKLHVLRFQLVKVVTRELHKLRPATVPSFAFGWLQLISHRSYMPRLLLVAHGWPMLKALLVDLFVFLRPFLRNVKLNAAVRQLYNGTLRVLLVLLHDFPEFLCEFHFAFCDVVPETCIQLRNLVLSAFPRLNAQGQPFKLPDPFTPNLKVDQLPDIAHSPRVRSDFRSALQRVATPYPKSDVEPGATGNMDLREALSCYVKTRQPAPLLGQLHRCIALAPAQARERGME
jgi:CCR4-NOT transcription complex subunit 1